METIRTRVAGLDVHRDRVVACVRLVDGGGRVTTQKRSFSTMTFGIGELASWLTDRAVTTAVMESTGVYWKPIVRHEAPCDRGEVRGLPRWAVAAAC
jgi:transposase